ncbi:MAG: hypothetical protein GF329_21595 [Candidatus Lokiarchaeota archaeon]|nr:hypothetical protein [Candidatus Lokiarchaeota archaeon]
MTNKWGAVSEEAEVLENLEESMYGGFLFDVKLIDKKVVKLNLSSCFSTALPESIRNLKSLEILNLIDNKL